MIKIKNLCNALAFTVCICFGSTAYADGKGPIAGVWISSLVTGTGIGLTTWGSLWLAQDKRAGKRCNENSNPTGSCDPWFTSMERGLIASGVLAISVGVIGLAVSAHKIKKGNAEAQLFDQRIHKLKLQGTRISVAYGAVQAPAMIRF